MLWDNGCMRVVLEIVFTIAIIGLFAFIDIVRLGWLFPRAGR
jgi:hypothetical protein